MHKKRSELNISVQAGSTLRFAVLLCDRENEMSCLEEQFCKKQKCKKKRNQKQCLAAVNSENARNKLTFHSIRTLTPANSGIKIEIKYIWVCVYVCAVFTFTQLCLEKREGGVGANGGVINIPIRDSCSSFMIFKVVCIQ